MSKEEEILHKLNTEDRNYIKEKFKEKDAKIQELETKLTESESESNARYSAWQEEIGECDRLRVALAEKEKELNRYAELFGMKDKDFYVVEKEEYGKMVSGAKQFAKETAIAELEQLKHDIWTNQHDDGWLDEKVDIYELTEMIDQKIKELKGENENV